MENRTSTTYKEDLSVERQQLIDVALSPAFPLALREVTALGIPQTLAAHGHLSAQEIAAHSEKHIDVGVLDRMLRALSFKGFFSVTVENVGNSIERRYGLNEVSKLLIEDEVGASLGALVLINLKEDTSVWKTLPKVLEQGPVHAFDGMKSIFTCAAEDPAFNKQYNAAMSGHSKLYMKSFLEHYSGFKNVKKLVDVAGGTGTNISMIVQKYPHIQGVNFDLPHVVQSAPQYPGVEHVGGNMFEAIPSADTMMVKSTLLNWGDKECLKILTNICKALPHDGKLIMVESILPDEHAVPNPFDSEVLAFDLLMMVALPQGRVRSLEEFKKLTNAAGFAKLVPVLKVDYLTLMEAYKSA